MMSERARTADEYVELVRQVMFELEDLQAASAYDIDDLASDNSLVTMLLQEMRDLYDSMQKGDYLFGRQDLPFMRLLKNASETDLPFLKLLYKINRTHTRGLDIAGT